MFRFIDKKLLLFIIIILITGISCSMIGVIGEFLTVAIVLVLNARMYKGNIITLYLAFFFLSDYSLVWGGNWGIINLPVQTIDMGMTQSSNYIGYLLLVLLIVKGMRIPKLNAIDYWIVIYFAYAMLSPLIAIDPIEPTKQIPRLIQFFTLYVLTRMLFRSPEALSLFFRYILVSFIPLLFVIFLQYMAGYFGEGYGKGRPLVLTPFIPYLLAITSLQTKGRWLLWLAILLSVFFGSYSASRRVFVSILGYFSLHFKMGIRFIIGIVFLFLLGPYLVQLLPSEARRRLENTTNATEDILEGGANDQNLDQLGTHRWSLLQAGYLMWKESPITGIGFKNNTVLIDDIGGLDKESRIHNYYAETLVDLGVIGILIVGGLILSTFTYLNRGLKYISSNDLFLLRMIKAYKIELIMIHVTAFFGSSMLYNKNAWVLYALVGCIASAMAVKGNTTADSTQVAIA